MQDVDGALRGLLAAALDPRDAMGPGLPGRARVGVPEIAHPKSAEYGDQQRPGRGVGDALEPDAGAAQVGVHRHDQRGADEHDRGLGVPGTRRVQRGPRQRKVGHVALHEHWDHGKN
jgi:hypothetical protein